MAKSEFVRRLDEVLANLNDIFTQEDYRKRSHTFNRRLKSGIIHVVNFQMGAYPFGNFVEIPGLRPNLYGKFTINLGVIIPEVFKLIYTKSLPNFISEPYCQIRQRVGSLMPESKDYWWDLNVEKDNLVSQIRSNLIEVVFPYLNRFSSNNDVIKIWEQDKRFSLARCEPNPSITVAIILVNQGRRQLAEALLRLEYREAIRLIQANRIKKISKELGFENIEPSDEKLEFWSP